MRVASRALGALLALTCCNENGGGGTNPKSSAPKGVASAPVTLGASDEAKQLASSRCAMCHGQTGRGDGPTAATLNPKPRDFSSREWQKSMSDGQLRTAILQGGAGVGKSQLMPANPDLADKPAVVDELVKIVRGYGN